MAAAPHDLPKSKFFKAHPGLLQDIVRAANPPVDLPIIKPLCIFAAGRQQFDAVVRVELTAKDDDVLDLLFGALPLTDAGWLYSRAKIQRVGFQGHWPGFRLRRA